MKGNAFSVDLRWREKVSNETRTTAVYLTTARTNLGLLISLLMQCPAPADERPLVDRLIGYTDAGLVHLKGLTKLEGLRLGFTQVTDAGLAHLKGLTNLTDLNLYRTQITDAGLVHLKGLTNLKTLYLTSTKVTDAGIAELQQSLPNCKIKKPNGEIHN